MHSWLEIVFNIITGRKYSTNGFFDDGGNFLQIDVILGIIFSVLPSENVAAVYLIGSVLHLRGKKDVPFQPRDVDVFVQVKCSKPELENYRGMFGEKSLIINGKIYPIHWIVYDIDPLKVYEEYGKLKLCFEKHCLYP